MDWLLLITLLIVILLLVSRDNRSIHYKHPKELLRRMHGSYICFNLSDGWYNPETNQSYPSHIQSQLNWLFNQGYITDKIPNGYATLNTVDIAYTVSPSGREWLDHTND